MAEFSSWLSFLKGIKYIEVFAPNFKRRDEIILGLDQRKRKVSALATVCDGGSKKVTVGVESWARLLRRGFAGDISKCPRCGADRVIISALCSERKGQRHPPLRS